MNFPWLDASLKTLSKRAVNAKLHHGLLLHGPVGIGKYEFTHALANLILCRTPVDNKPCGECQSCLLNRSEAHPDKYEVFSDKQIGVDQIREAIGKLTGTAQMSGNKVLIIVDAETMTEAAANALLKSLEEPTAQTFLLLVTSYPEQLLPTILSRCEKVALSGPALTECREWMKEQGFSDITDEEIALNRFSPKRLLDYVDSDNKLTYGHFKEKITALKSASIAPSQLANEWQENAKTVIEWVQFSLTKSAKLMPTSPDGLFTLDEACIDARDRLNKPGVNKLLLLSGILSLCQHHLDNQE